MKYCRRLLMDGAENARDLGGYATADGGVTRYGVFLRSALPENLSTVDVDLLRNYHVIRSVDLRSEQEASAEPSNLAGVDEIEYINIPLFNSAAASASASERKKEWKKSPVGFVLPDWNVHYIDMLEQHKDRVRELMEAMAGNGCIHFNCFTGKDRTGLCAAMLLSIAGVSAEDICADYSLSMAYLGRRYETIKVKYGVKLDGDGYPDLGSGFCATLPSYMRRTLGYLDEQYGGVLQYLKHCGVGETLISGIREKFVEYD